VALITAAEVREFLPGLSGDDTVIAALVTAVDGAMARYCGFPAYDSTGTLYTLEDQAYTLYLPAADGWEVSEDGQTLYLPRPLASITTIHEDEDWGYGAAFEVASTNWTTDKARGQVVLLPSSSHGAWSRSHRALKVVATCGFATVPETVKLAAKLWAAHAYQLRSRHGKQSISGMQVVESLRDETMPASVRELLHPLMQRGALL